MNNKIVHRKVTQVIDGDTFKVGTKVNGSNYIRLANVDAPDKGERGYTSAKQNLTKKIAGQSVAIKPVGRSYSRVVADVKKNGRKIN
ncbi:MAG: hypothetical protein PHN22_04540 [Candidatus ainarchaeum sp.]|nr:hypothetical protein [Candidatus ainarchaeum sp.]